MRSASSGGESSDDVGLRQVASRLRASWRSQGGGRRASGKRVPAKEVSKLIKFGEGRAYRETAKFDSESDLDDFLVPDDEEEEDADDDSGDGQGDDDDDDNDDGDDARGRHGEVQRAPGRMWRKKEERGLVVSPRKVRRVVDSDSASSGVDPGGDGGRPSSEVSSESEEWDEGLGGQSSKEARAERALRERKSLRDMHGGLSPLQRIRSAQQRALGVGVGGEAAEDGDGDEEEAGMEVEEAVVAGRKPGKKEKKKETKTKKKNKKEEETENKEELHDVPGPELELNPEPLHLLSSSSGTTSTATRSASAGSVSTLTRSSLSSTSSSSTSSSECDSFVTEASLGSAERQQVEHLLMTEVGSLGAMSEEEAFRAYMELLFCSSIDPEYETQVESSQSHREHYATAKAKIEYLIITAQQYAQSQVWVNCNPFLLEAVEQYSRFEIRKRIKRYMHKASSADCINSQDEVNCAACNKWRGHTSEAMCLLRFVGRRHENAIMCPGESKLGEGLRLSNNYLIASPVYQQNRGLWGKGHDPKYALERRLYNEADDEADDEGKHEGKKRGKKKGNKAKRNKTPPKTFYLGYVCCRRITTFHALLHFRRHCLIYLTRRAKDISLRRGKMSMNKLLDLVLDEDAHKLMYTCFQSMLAVAQTMQLSTGKEAQYAVSKHGAFRTRAPQEVLLGNEGTDVSSLDWSEGEGDGGSGDDNGASS